MGEPMARSLTGAGFRVIACVHNNRSSIERLLAERRSEDAFTEAADPAAVARGSDAVVVCVPDAPQVEDVLFGRGGAAEGLGAGGATIVVDMSTISPIASQTFARRLNERGVAFVDAPVSGGPLRAATGDLTIMVGASESDFARVEPVLRAMGTPFHLGGVGMGETVKLVNQIIISSVMIADCEALAFAKRAGANLDQVRQVIATATGSNYVLDRLAAEDGLSRKLRGRIRARSPAKGSGSLARCGANDETAHAALGISLSTLHGPIGRRGRRARLQRDRQGVRTS